MHSQMTARDLGLTLEFMHLLLDAERQVARLVIDRPGKLNAITMAMRDQIADALRALERDGRARVVILRGAGGEAFSAGGEIPGFLEKEPGPISLLHENVAAPERFPGPVIAAIDGYCFGVGLELALACDFRIATSRAVFAHPEIRLGMIPGSGGSQRLTRLIGLGRTKDMVLRGRRVMAAEALAWGIATQVVDPDQLDAAAEALALELVGQPRLALETAKRVLNLGQSAGLDAALQLEGFAYGMPRGTHDFAEGVHAFAEKRPPRFQGYYRAPPAAPVPGGTRGAATSALLRDPPANGVGCDPPGGTSDGPGVVRLSGMAGATNRLSGTKSDRSLGVPPETLRPFGPSFGDGAINLLEAAEAPAVP